MKTLFLKAFSVLILTLIFQGQLFAQEAKPPCPDLEEFKASQPQLSQPPNPGRKDIYVRKHLEQRRPMAYDHLEERDIIWEKRITRVIDIREQINNPFAYPSRPFAAVLVDAALNGDVPIYWPDDELREDRFTEVMPIEDLQKKIRRTDTLPAFDQYGDIKYDCYGNMMIMVLYEEFNPESVNRFRIEEVWYMDKESGRLGVRIVGIAPLMEVMDYSTGNVLGEGPIFWMYYPETRDFLSRNRAFNSASDVDVMSWEDIFEMRLFSSYITKDSNVRDERIKDRFSGMEILYESDRIHQGIFSMEQSSWQH